MKKIVLTAILLSFAFFGINYIVDNILHLSRIQISIIVPIAFVLITKLSFNLVDFLFPPTNNLSTEQVKSFLKSKIFWLAVLNLVAVLLKGLFEIEFDIETQEEILNLDWSNILQAIISIFIIAIRKFDLLKFLD